VTRNRGRQSSQPPSGSVARLSLPKRFPAGNRTRTATLPCGAQAPDSNGNNGETAHGALAGRFRWV
jgi:hypothetical protein